MLNLKTLLGNLFGTAGYRKKPQRAGLHVQALEERWCPAGVWTWVGLPVNMGGDGLWSNPTGFNWQLNNNPVAAGQYPGFPGDPTLNIPPSQDDIVEFSVGGALAGPATVDKPLIGLRSRSRAQIAAQLCEL